MITYIIYIRINVPILIVISMLRNTYHIESINKLKKEEYQQGFDRHTVNSE